MNNPQRSFDDKTRSELGIYVYGLLDPLSKRVFYIGKGGGNSSENLEGGSNLRIFDHFFEVESALAAGRQLTAKQLAIKAVWDRGNDVECHIFRRLLRDPQEAFQVEGGIIVALRLSTNGGPDNDNDGRNVERHGALTLQDALDLGAPLVNPSRACEVVLFNIGTSLANRAARTPDDYYECTRAEWVLGLYYRDRPDLVAVGVQNEISRGVFGALQWNLTRSKQNPDKQGRLRTVNYHSFKGEWLPPENELLGKNWKEVLGKAPWRKRGGAIVVHFDGEGNFSILRGASEQTRGHSFSCVPKKA